MAPQCLRDSPRCATDVPHRIQPTFPLRQAGDLPAFLWLEVFMATLDRDKRNGNYLVRFRYDGQQYQRSCRTTRAPQAKRILATVEETLDLLNTGRLSLPEDTEIGRWILSGGKSGVTARQCNTVPTRLGEVCDKYFADQGQKAASTLVREKPHIRHLKRILRTSTPIRLVTLDALKTYVKKRRKETFRHHPVSDKTIRKELVTFRQIWFWAKRHGHAHDSCPLLGPDGRWEVRLEKPKQAIRFQTWNQIERRIDRGGLSDNEKKTLWRSLFLDETQVTALLEYVKAYATHPFVYPMFVFAAYTGARRSELCRSEVEDFDFEQNQVLIRERKRRKDLSGTTRFVPMHPKLKGVMQDWFAVHPGGHYTLSAPSRLTGRVCMQMRHDSATGYLRRVLRGSRWDVLSGFHVLRHSFGSNLARTGKVSSSTIGAWMGHSTEEMRELYQHLFPQDGVEQISCLA